MEFEELDELYREIILDHYRNPRNRRKLENADMQAEGNNPFCGDEIALQLNLNDGHVQEVGFQGRGCSISQASGSMLMGLLRGKTLGEIKSLTGLFKDMIHGKELSEEELEQLGELEALAGVRQFPIRIKCALLPWATLQDGLEAYMVRKK